MATKKNPLKRKTKPTKKPVILAVHSLQTPKQPEHLDYRIVLANVWADALKTEKQKALVLRHRDVFESIGGVQATQLDFKTPALVLREGPQPAMIRALGIWETTLYEKHNIPIAHMGEEGKMWLSVWQTLRSWLSWEYDHRLLGRLMYDALVALALNAGFTTEDIA